MSASLLAVMATPEKVEVASSISSRECRNSCGLSSAVLQARSSPLLSFSPGSHFSPVERVRAGQERGGREAVLPRLPCSRLTTTRQLTVTRKLQESTTMFTQSCRQRSVISTTRTGYLVWDLRVSERKEKVLVEVSVQLAGDGQSEDGERGEDGSGQQ